jgi:hypothetical protein
MEKFLSKTAVIIITIATLATGMTSIILNRPANQTNIGMGMFIGFLVSISLIFLQILFALLQNTASINSVLFLKSNIFIPDDFEKLSGSLYELINSNKELSLKIICYGTSGYRNVVEKISESKNKKLKAGVVVYNPHKSIHFFENDKPSITSLIAKAGNDNVVFYHSEILPSIRACAVYDGNKNVVWCCLQTYCYEAQYNYKTQLRTADYRKIPAIFADQNNMKLLRTIEKIIFEEYERLGGK